MICDRVREAFPGAVFVHGEESGREIGKRPTLAANEVELDWTHAALIEFQPLTKGGRK